MNKNKIEIFNRVYKNADMYYGWDIRDEFKHFVETENLNRVREQLIRDNQQLRKQKEAAESLAAEAALRQALTEEYLRKLLELDEGIVDAELSPPESLETLDAAEARAKAVREADSTQLLRFLAGYDELLKRAEIWTLHVSDRGDTELNWGGGSQSHSFRLEQKSQVARTDEFIQQMRAAYSKIPQPKGLVVILVSYSPRAVAGNYQPVLDGMPNVIEWLSKDAAGRTRFEFSVIGAINDPVRDLPPQEMER